MAYKWKPNASQRKAFAERMKNPQEEKAYTQRKIDKAEKRRAGSKFDYDSAGGSYIPTREQYDFAMRNGGITPEQSEACNEIIYGYSYQEKVHHDQIHIVNEMRRALNV